jgi:hypothetical protein
VEWVNTAESIRWWLRSWLIAFVYALFAIYQGERDMNSDDLVIGSDEFTVRAASTKTIAIAALLGGVVGAVANVVLAVVAKAMDVPLEVVQSTGKEPTEIPAAAFAFATLIGALVGFGIAKLLSKRIDASKKFVMVTGALTALSLVFPFLSDASTATQVVLALAHLVAGLAIITALSRAIRN